MANKPDVQEALRLAQEVYEAATVALGAAESAARAAGVDVAPRELTLERLRIVERDGTLRLLIGNSTIAQAVPMRGREVAHPGRDSYAGMLFVNDEGTECGGLLWWGNAEGAGVHLSFDSYEQNDAIVVEHEDKAGRRSSWLEFVDRPEWSMADFFAEYEKAAGQDEQATITDRYFGKGAGWSRMRLAREDDGSVGLCLRDAAGRDRIRLIVGIDGEPRIEVLDADGAVVGRL